MLWSIEPCFLTAGVYRHAQENNLPLDVLTSLSDSELLELGEAKLSLLPRNRKRFLESKKTLRGSLKKRYSWSAILTHIRPQRSNK